MRPALPIGADRRPVSPALLVLLSLIPADRWVTVTETEQAAALVGLVRDGEDRPRLLDWRSVDQSLSRLRRAGYVLRNRYEDPVVWQRTATGDRAIAESQAVRRAYVARVKRRSLANHR